MASYIITIDLGTTNIKTGIYDSELKEAANWSEGVEYDTQSGFVEFDAEGYWELCKKGIQGVLKKSGINSRKVISISLTGQAESLILLGDDLKPLRNGISWMDNRSDKECDQLKRDFDPEMGYRITGQPDIITTWPITKILWIKNNEREIFNRVRHFLLLKDFIIFKLTGQLVAECTIYNFSYYFDIIRKRYWQDILDHVGIKTSQLPELIEPGESAGALSPGISNEFNFSEKVSVNAGALDHFAGMIGTGNIEKGIISETTGTVLAVATLIDQPLINEYNIPCHYNAVKDTYVLLPVCESGGICFEWFKNTFFPEKSFDFLNQKIGSALGSSGDLIFLPYLTGANSPEFNPRARGVFYGITLNHTGIHFARAVMEGITYLLKKNIEYLEKLGIRVDDVISLGGATRADVWNQMKADITGKNILIPEYEEATSLGAAVLASVKCGFYKSVEEATKNIVKTKRVYSPVKMEYYDPGYRKFKLIYDQLTPVFNG